MDRRACRDGNHAYGVPTDIGAGLTRNRCKYCGSLEIDLRRSGDEPSETEASAADRSRRFFASNRRVTIFDIEQAVSAGLYEVEPDR